MSDLRCPTCKTKVRETDRFCGACQCALKAEPAEPAGEVTATAIDDGPDWSPTPDAAPRVVEPLELPADPDDEEIPRSEESDLPSMFEALDPGEEELRAALLDLRGVIESRLSGRFGKVRRLFSSKPALPPGRSESDVRRLLQWFNAGGGATPALVAWFTCFDGGFSLDGPKVGHDVLSLEAAIKERKSIASLGASEEAWVLFRRRTTYLPLTYSDSGIWNVYDTQPGRHGISFLDHEVADEEEVNAQSFLELISEIKEGWSSREAG